MMHWKHNVKTASLVTNPAPFEPDTGSYRRQKYCMDVLRESSPPWANIHFLDLAYDVDGGDLKRNSFDELGDKPPLPSVREMMCAAIDQEDHWAGVAISDVVFTHSFWLAIEKETEADIVIARASQVPDIAEGDRVVYTPLRKPNELSMDVLFIRRKAIGAFLEDFPDVWLAEYWDDACVAWARRYRKLGVRVLNDHETTHRMHEPSWANGVKFGAKGAVSGLRAVGIYNRSAIVDFKKRRSPRNV
jgi:hypothetical protein